MAMRAASRFLLLSGLSAVAFYACRTTDSDLKADDEFGGEKLGYWYEILSFREGDKYNFIDYHKTNKSVLLGNNGGDLVPETLKGLWFMDGNPLSDKTVQFANVHRSRAGHDILLKVGDPTNFSWTNLEKSHTLNKLINRFTYEYEFSFHDCPPDVKKERETMWGMADGSCTKADRQFATITPYVKIGLLRTPVPPDAVYFDMYLRPKEGDHLVWERRSKVARLVDDIAAAFQRKVDQRGWHRYQMVQILDKNGNRLQSFDRFTTHLRSFAAENNLSFETMLFYKCYEGRTGCDQQALTEGGAVDPRFEGEDGARLFGGFPFL